MLHIIHTTAHSDDIRDGCTKTGIIQTTTNATVNQPQTEICILCQTQYICTDLGRLLQYCIIPSPCAPTNATNTHTTIICVCAGRAI